MADMSPLGRLILKVMRAGALASAGFVALVIAIEIWKRWRFEAAPGSAGQEYGFFAVLAVMLLGFLWLARSIGRELKQHQP